MTEEPGNSRRRLLGYVAIWVVAALAAVAVGVIAVSSVGASVRDRGPLGNAVPSSGATEGAGAPQPSGPSIARTIRDEFGTFEVECRGVVAYGLGATTTNGWRTVSFERGPDDDVDAVFSRADRSIELEVYCNQGEPTIGDREVKTLVGD